MNSASRFQGVPAGAESGPGDQEGGDPSDAGLCGPQPRGEEVGGPMEVPSYFRSALKWQWWLAACLALPALPIVAIAMVMVKLTSRGPALYYQTRVGLNGRHFEVIKIRTMRIDAEAGTGAVWTTSVKDPRITWVGAILRLTHIDELPQLWNVLRGDMALVGPRPERPEFTGMLALSIPGYLNRLNVLPGVTGLAQVNLPADSGVESVRQKLDLDLRYIDEGSLSLDLRIILCTAARLLCIRTKALRRLLDVDREPREIASMAAPETSAADGGSRWPDRSGACCVPATELALSLKPPRSENGGWDGMGHAEMRNVAGLARNASR